MNKWILGVSVILFLLTSCSKDNDEGTPQSDDIMNGGAELNSAPMSFRLSWLTLILLEVRLVRH